MWSPRWTVRGDVSNIQYVCCYLVEIARKSVKETANVGRKVSGVDLLCCFAAKVAASAIIVHG